MTPNPYCQSLPTQLRAWDSHALRYYMECPRKYQLGIAEGWRGVGSNIHTEFGLFYHDDVELFDRLMATGTPFDEAVDQTIEHLLASTWTDSGPWGGTYIPGWRCNAWVPGKRNKYLCDASRSWWGGHRPDCPKCHGPVTNRWVYAHNDKKKNRYTLLAAVVDYMDTQKSSGVQPIVFPDGQVALELSFSLELPYVCPDGTPYLLCGHLDSMVSVAGEHCVRERKTTGSSLSIGFFDRYAPDVQIDNYDLAGNMMFGPTLHPTAVMVEVMQVGVDYTKLGRGFVTITEGRREETLRDLGYWIARAEADAKAGYYPKNTASCNMCQFRRICKEEPGDTRQRLLEAHFTRNYWNPLEER